MARRTLRDLQEEAAAAEAMGIDETATKKKAAKKKAPAKKRVRKAAKAERKRLSWGIFSGTLKEEARFPYDQREQADEKLAALRSKGRRLYFLQPIKESLSAQTAVPEDEEPDEDEDAPKAVDPDAEPDEDEEPELEEADPPFAGEDDED